jgi:hypothetical protein
MRFGLGRSPWTDRAQEGRRSTCETAYTRAMSSLIAKIRKWLRIGNGKKP